MGLTRSGVSYAERMLCLTPLLVAMASTTAASVVSTGGPTDPTQRRANSTTSIVAIAHTFTAVPGRLTSGCDAGSPLPSGCDVSPRQNVTLASAESICAALGDCVGISFQSPTATPAGVVQNVYFKGADVDCGDSRFGDGICPYTSDGTWHTYLKDNKPVPRTPVWLRHYNLSVVPPRCGDINIAPLFPYDIDDRFISNYAGVTIEEFSSFVLEHGECGKVGPYGNPRALSYTKRSNPASTGTPWLGPDGGAGGGPGDPGYPGTGGSFQSLCMGECGCLTGGTAGPTGGMNGSGPCTDENCVGRCVVCSPSFNKKLASNSTLVRLWCDPTDPACKNGDPTRLPKSVRVLADFAPGSPTNVKWTDHNSIPPTSNLTIKQDQGGDSYAEFSGAVYANTGYTRIATIAPAFKKIDLSEYVEEGGEYVGGGAIVVEARYPKAHHCYIDPNGGGSLCHFEGFKLALTSFKGKSYSRISGATRRSGAGMWRRSHAAKSIMPSPLLHQRIDTRCIVVGNDGFMCRSCNNWS